MHLFVIFINPISKIDYAYANFAYVHEQFIHTTPTMPVKRLNYIFLDQGEFLFDKASGKVYSFKAPHTLVGFIDQSSQQLTLK